MLRTVIAAGLCASSSAAHVNHPTTTSKRSLAMVGTVARSDMLEPLVWSREPPVSAVDSLSRDRTATTTNKNIVAQRLLTGFVAIATFMSSNDVMNDHWKRRKSSPDLLSKRGHALTKLAAGTSLLHLRGGANAAASVPATVFFWNVVMLRGDDKTAERPRSKSLTTGQRIAIGHLTSLAAGTSVMRIRGGGAASPARMEAIVLAWDLFMRLGLAPFL